MQMVEEKLEYWVDKYENDTDAKDEELDALKVSKANNLEMLQRLAKEVRHQQHLSDQPCKTASWLFPVFIQIRNQDHGKNPTVILRCRVGLRGLVLGSQGPSSHLLFATCDIKEG